MRLRRMNLGLLLMPSIVGHSIQKHWMERFKKNTLSAILSFLMKMHIHCKPLTVPCECCPGHSLCLCGPVQPRVSQCPAFKEDGLDHSSFLSRRWLQIAHSEITANKPLPCILSLTFHITGTERMLSDTHGRLR